MRLRRPRLDRRALLMAAAAAVVVAVVTTATVFTAPAAKAVTAWQTYYRYTSWASSAVNFRWWNTIGGSQEYFEYNSWVKDKLQDGYRARVIIRNYTYEGRLIRTLVHDDATHDANAVRFSGGSPPQPPTQNSEAVSIQLCQYQASTNRYGACLAPQYFYRPPELPPEGEG